MTTDLVCTLDLVDEAGPGEPETVMLFSADVSPDRLQVIPWLADAQACTGFPRGGWYFEPPGAPDSMVLCPCSCTLARGGDLQALHNLTPIE